MLLCRLANCKFSLDISTQDNRLWEGRAVFEGKHDRAHDSCVQRAIQTVKSNQKKKTKKKSFDERKHRYEQMFKLFAAKDAEIAALASKGQKADRSIRTERLTSTNLDEFVDGELNVAPSLTCEISPLFQVFLAHATGNGGQSRNVSARDQDELLNLLPGSPEISSQSQRISSQQHSPRGGGGRGTTQGSPSYSQYPASGSPPGSSQASPKKVPAGKKAAVVVDSQPKKKQKVISRKNAFV